MNRKLRLLMCSDDPSTILSYGILSKLLIEKWYKDIDIHYLSLQYQLGKPIVIRDRKGRKMYTKYAAHNEGQRNPKNLKFVIDKVKPDLFWTNFDIQHYINVQKYVPDKLTWLGWCPWDNHDPNQVPRAQKAFSKVDSRIAISKFGMEFLNKANVEVEDYIYNIIDTDVFYPLPPDHKDIKDFWKINNHIPEDCKLLLFVGRPNWRKRMTHMLAILKELVNRGNEDIRLFLHSSLNDPACDVDLKQIINAFGLTKYIINDQFFWDQGVPAEDLRILYNIADLYIAPHAGEGFGMPIAESMACGTPFIASDICTTPEFAGKNQERGLRGKVEFPRYPNGQPVLDKGVWRTNPVVDDFADKIESLLADENRRKKMGENGVEWVRNNCTVNKVSRKWRDLFDRYNIQLAKAVGWK